MKTTVCFLFLTLCTISIRAVDGGIQATLTSGKTIMLGGGVAVS